MTRTDIGYRALSIALVAAVLLLVLPYLSGLIGAAVLYVIAVPLVRRIDPTGGKKWPPLLAVLVLFLVLVLPGVWLLAQLVAQLPDGFRIVQESPAFKRLMTLQLGDVDVGTRLQQASAAIMAWSSRQTITAIGGVLNATLNLIIALFGAYYLFTTGDALWDKTKAVLPLAPRTAELLRLRFYRVTEAMLLGVVLTGVAQGTLVAVAFAVLGFDHPLLWGGATAAASILPMFGSAIVWLPGVLVLIAQDRMVAAITLFALGALLVSNIDNALRLVVYRRVSQIHPMITLIGAFAGVRAFGLAGILLGPLVLSYAIELLRIYHASDTPSDPLLEVAA